ncbi:MAG TPA: PAS domain S-box protein [Sphingomonadaceae bacterium]|nr:PAS domain S-box protein [Sphingomonadaceae bacterium]
MARTAGEKQQRSWVARPSAVVLLAAVFYAAAWCSLALSEQTGHVSALWLPNALLVAVMLRGGGSRVPETMACFAANVAANLTVGDDARLALGLASCNMFEVLAIVWCVRRFAPGRVDLTSLPTLLTFSVFAGVLVPTVTATFATGLLHVAGGAPDWVVWFTYLKAHALGQIVVAPILLIIADAWANRARWTRAAASKGALNIGAVVLVCVGVFTQTRFPLLFLVIPFVLITAFRSGATGAACAVIVVGLASALGTAFGTGPIAMVDGGIDDKLTMLQLFLATSFVAALPVAAALQQRQRLADALNRSERLLGTITDNIRDVVFRTDRQGRWLFLNPAWHDLTGRSIAESMGEPVDALIVPQDLEDARAEFLSLFTGERSEVQMRVRFQHIDGNIRWVESTIRRQHDEGGATTGTIGSIRDITEQQEQVLAMAAREQEWRLITTNSADMIVRTGMDRVRRYVSPASRRLLGFEPEEMINQGSFFGIHPDDVADVEARCVAAIKDGGPAHSIYRQRHRDGRYVWVEASYSVVRDRNGTPVEFMASVRDFEARRKLEEDLREARDRAEDAARLKASFLANMSHELRTPMNGVIGFTELLLASDIEGEQRRWAGMIGESGRTMMTLLNDILDLSKIEADQIEIVNEPFNLHHAIAAAVRMIADDARAKGLVLDLLIDVDVPRFATGDALRLGQIVRNLLSNAVKFTHVGFIRVGACAVGKELHLTVEDSGCGIAPDRQAAVFEQFVQADTSIARSYGGTGLGLAISQRLARLQGGDLVLSKSNAQGTRMLLRVPLVPALACDEPAASPPHDAVRPYLQAGRARILVAEDAEINQLLMDALLRRHGHDATIVGDGGEAVRAFTDAEMAGEGYDLVLMDMQMPRIDGLEATRRLRALGGRGLTIPVVALTANAYASDVDACLAAGMTAHLPKPIDAEKLMATIGRLTREALHPAGAAAPEDPDIAALRGRYEALKASYAAELRELQNALAGAGPEGIEAARIAGICHKIAGSAGMFGEAALGDLARGVEDAAQAGATTPLLAVRTGTLVNALAAAA